MLGHDKSLDSTPPPRMMQRGTAMHSPDDSTRPDNHAAIDAEAERLRRLEALVDEARRRFAEDASRAATDEPTMHFAAGLLASFEELTTTIRRYRYARAHRANDADS